MNKIKSINCRMCGKEFTTKSHRAIFCSQLCGDRYRSQRPPKEIICAWCEKLFIKHFKRGWDKQRFCSVVCREEFHSINDKRSPFYRDDKKRKEIVCDKNKYVCCRVCGQIARRRLSTHILSRHNISWSDYLNKYPNEKNGCNEVIDYIKSRSKRKLSNKEITDNNGWNIITRGKKDVVGHKCELCGFSDYAEALIGHHKKPVHLGGLSTKNNCMIVCANCHCHIHNLINNLKRDKNTIEDIVRTCEKLQEAGSKSQR